jgi:hypothetical protein
LIFFDDLGFGGFDILLVELRCMCKAINVDVFVEIEKAQGAF